MQEDYLDKSIVAANFIQKSFVNRLKEEIGQEASRIFSAQKYFHAKCFGGNRFFNK